MLVLIGASASGKTDIAKILISEYGFKKMVTTTTRKKRDGEISHVDYHFITKKSFKKKIEENKFLEHIEYDGEFYGTPCKGASTNKVLIVDPKGANSIHKKDIPNTVFFLLETDEETRKNRMLERGDDLIQVTYRLEQDNDYFKFVNFTHVDYIVDTTELTQEELSEKIYTLYYNHINNDNQMSIYDMLK